MDKIYESVINTLNNKKSELQTRQEDFCVMCNNEMQSGCFERNAINDLIIMQQLKSEIAELEHLETLIRVQLKK